MTEHERLLAEVRRLQVELERYRDHAQRTSKLFLSVTNYADWVRENARGDAELAFAKRGPGRELNRARASWNGPRQLARVQTSLRAFSLDDGDAIRLSAFLDAGLQARRQRAFSRARRQPEPRARRPRGHASGATDIGHCDGSRGARGRRRAGALADAYERARRRDESSLAPLIVGFVAAGSLLC